MTDEHVPPAYQDEHGGWLPSIPVPGKRIRVLFRLDDPDRPMAWQGAYYLGENAAGLWWTPDDDRDGAMWTPWTEIASIDGGMP